MTEERKKEIEKAIISSMAGFGVVRSEPYQSMGLIGLCEMRASIPRKELVSVLIAMEGVIVDFDAGSVQIPTSFF